MHKIINLIIIHFLAKIKKKERRTLITARRRSCGGCHTAGPVTDVDEVTSVYGPLVIYFKR
jgi:hypothetical protein